MLTTRYDLADTTSIALTSALFHIANNRDVYLRLKAEVREAEEQGRAHDPISFDEAQALPYFQLVLKEALRIHSSTGLPMWRVVPAGGMEICGKFFPPGVSDDDPDETRRGLGRKTPPSCPARARNMCLPRVKSKAD